MLDPLIAQLLQHCWGHARALHMISKVLGDVSFPRCTAGPNIVGSCWIRLYSTANNIFGIIRHYENNFPVFPEKSTASIICAVWRFAFFLAK